MPASNALLLLRLMLINSLATFTWKLQTNIFGVVASSSGSLQSTSNLPTTAEFINYKEFNNTNYLGAVRESLREYELRRQKYKHPRSKRAVKRVCYGELGCFEDSGPFAYLEMLPSPPEEINTKFYFYSTKKRSDRPLMELPFLNMTAAFQRFKKRSHRSNNSKNNEKNSQLTTEGPASHTTRASIVRTTKKNVYRTKQTTLEELDGFDKLSVRIIVHGFGSACPHVWIYEMKTALMAVEDCIVICVDWENGATFPNYVRAAANTRLVGKQLAMLIKNLKEHKGLNLTRTHIIGFSLGAHVSGFAGTELPGLSRITGLDPAGPLFEAQHPKVRLDSSDADFVDVIHSNGENLILGGLGSWQPMGHVDFYPNGGRVQTGCSNLFVGAVTDFIWSAQATDEEEGRSLCNHRRAYKFFIDSVAPRCMFPAFPCDSYDNFQKGKCFPCAQSDTDVEEGVPRCGNMGYYADRSTGRGQLYLVTRDEEPFCAHQFQLQIYNSFNDLPLRTIGRLEAILEGEGGLNETFLISDKDDAEFFAGDIISKIVVPHPALGFPTSLSLHYKSYSGWLSKGLPHWDIDKIVLTNSFGRSHSLCKTSTKLSSGIPVRMKLQPGNCELENQEDYGAYTTAASPTEGAAAADLSGQESVDTLETDGVESVKHRKDVFNLGTSFKLGENDSFLLEENDDLPWKPILEGNSLDKDVSESSRSLSLEPTEIFEPVLSERRLTVNDARNLRDFRPTEEIVEPVLKPKTHRLKKAKEIKFNEEGTRTTKTSTESEEIERSTINKKKTELIRITPISATSNSSVDRPKTEQDESLTVQLFPFRLGELLQRAERYARETLLPLISAQAPKIFGFNFNPGEEDAAQLKEEPRQPRYIPRFEDSLSRIRKNNSENKRSTRRISSNSDSDLFSAESVNQRNIFQLLRSEEVVTSSSNKQRNTGVEVNYYTNVQQAESRALQPEVAEYQAVFIDLPTYRPPRDQKRNKKRRRRNT